MADEGEKSVREAPASDYEDLLRARFPTDQLPPPPPDDGLDRYERLLDRLALGRRPPA